MSDLVSRQAAIKNAHFPVIDDASYEVVRVDDILALPSAEPKTGEWILKPMLPNIHRYKCSNCMSHHRARYDFCPSCGSKMLGEDGEEE